MKTKNLLLISCFIIIFLSLNTISSTTLNDEAIDSNDNLQSTDDTLIESNSLKQQTNYVYVDGNSQSDYENGSMDSPYKTFNNENIQKIAPESTVYVSNGVYEIGAINITQDISIIGENKDEVIFIPNVSENVFVIEENINVNFFNFTLKNFQSDENSLIMNKGSLMMEDINFINNTGTSRTSKKGNIFNEGVLEIRNSTFENNTASFGAVLYNTGNAFIVASDFNTNHIYNVGGVIYSLRGNLTVYDSRFYKNAAVSGAAMYNAAGYLYVNNTDFVENDAEHFYGGAIYSTGVSIVNNSLFDSNHANMDGGAITTTNEFTIVNCSFIGNYAEDNGGAIENVAWAEKEIGCLNILNSSFIENGAGANGGVIINYNKPEYVGDNATVTVRNCLFEDNSAVNGGVIYSEQYFDVQNSVFMYNEADENNVICSDEKFIKSLDNNWWGTNSPTLDDIGVMPAKWLVLDFTNVSFFASNFNCKLQVSLNTNNIGEVINLTIPERIVTFYAQRTILPENNLKINSMLDYVIKSEGDDISVCVDNQYLTLQPSEKMNIIITFNTIPNVKYKEKLNISGRFTDANGRAIQNTNVHIKINNKSYKAVTDRNGNYTLLATASVTGTNTLTIGYNGNTYYNNYETNTTFNVEKQDIIITYGSIQDVKYKENLTITGKITDINSNGLYNINSLITINNKLYKSKTDKTGTFTLITTANNIGNNNVIISYDGNNFYNAYETSTSFNVDKQDLIITYEAINDVKYKDKITITGQFTDANKRAIRNTNVLITINGRLYKAKTDSMGNYMLSTSVNSIGINNVTLGYNGNDYYNSYEINTSFNAKKQDLLITYKALGDVKYNDKLNITGTFTDVNGRSIRNTNVQIKINDKMYKAVTDKEGIYALLTTANVLGVNNLTLSYAGNDFYNAYETSTTFTVKNN